MISAWLNFPLQHHRAGGADQCGLTLMVHCKPPETAWQTLSMKGRNRLQGDGVYLWRPPGMGYSLLLITLQWLRLYARVARLIPKLEENNDNGALRISDHTSKFKINDRSRNFQPVTHHGQFTRKLKPLSLHEASIHEEFTNRQISLVFPRPQIGRRYLFGLVEKSII